MISVSVFLYSLTCLIKTTCPSNTFGIGSNTNRSEYWFVSVTVDFHCCLSVEHVAMNRFMSPWNHRRCNQLVKGLYEGVNLCLQ